MWPQEFLSHIARFIGACIIAQPRQYGIGSEEAAKSAMYLWDATK